MNNSEFEDHLRRQPLKPLPPHWRQQILRSCQSAPKTSAAQGVERLRELFWPHPRAWGALAVVWIVILTINLINHQEQDGSVHARPTQSEREQLRMALVEQRRLWQEVVGPESTASQPAHVKPKEVNTSPRSGTSLSEVAG